MSSHEDAPSDTNGGQKHFLPRLWHGIVKNSLWHLTFFPALRPELCTASVLRAHSSTALKTPSDSAMVVVSTLYSLALLEAVGYTEAGPTARQLWSAHVDGSTPSLSSQSAPAEQMNWLDRLCAAVLRQAGAFSSASANKASALATVLAEVQQQCTNVTESTALDALFAELARDYLHHLAAATSAESKPGAPQRRTVSIFSYATLPFQKSPGAGWEKSASAGQHQRQWYEARLYAALACSTSMSTPAPLARLLVAYAHQDDGRLQAVASANLNGFLYRCHDSQETKKSIDASSVTGAVADTAPAALAQVRLSGVVAGVLEYALWAARVRTALSVAELRACVSVGNASQKHPPQATAFALCVAPHAPLSAALLLNLIMEECSYYQQTAPAGTGNGGGGGGRRGGVTAAVLHAVQELLFTIVLGNGTQHMRNRPEPSAASKRPRAEGSGGSGVTRSAMIVETTRSVTLPEADAISQEFFPALAQQLGLEWAWSPLLRHLSSLDKVQVSAEEVGVCTGLTPASSLGVRWSSHMLMDTILLSLARKTYPQRLLNVLPGSYERLLSNLDLLPPMRPQGDDGGDAGHSGTGRRSGGPLLFEMPVYYAVPASTLVAYFQRAGVSGLRIEEAERILTTATSTHAMVVQLRAQAPSGYDADGRRGSTFGAGRRETQDNSDGAVDSPHYQKKGSAMSHAYALTHERVEHLISRYQGEVLLAAVVVHTQLRVPSQVQQLMRVLAPLFLKINLAWRTHDDGCSTLWLLQPRTDFSATGMTASAARFSAEAEVLLDHVGYEFYPLEWLPAALSTDTAQNESSIERFAFPYSLLAAVGHQFQLQLRGAPLGNSGDATLRHPCGPRASAVMPSISGAALLATDRDVDESDIKATATAWRRTERFLTGLMQLCYLDPKTSSMELEGTLAVSSTRRVLTANGRSATLGSNGGANVGPGVRGSGADVVAAADVASHRLRSLLQQPTVMDAVWGTMKNTASARENRASQRYPHQCEKRSKSVPVLAEAQEHLRAMQQLLLEYGSASFDTTVEAADFALTIAQAFLPLSSGTSALLYPASGKTGPATMSGKKSEALLRSGLAWGSAVVGNAATKTRVQVQLQQHQPQPQQEQGAASFRAVLARVYNSATVDTVWLARSALRYVPQRIWEKIRSHQAERLALVQRHRKWASYLLESTPTTLEATPCDLDDAHCVDPLLMEQWTQWERVLEQLGLSGHLEGGMSTVASTKPHPPSFSAEDITCAQWLWYSPHFAAELDP
ncbi:hypothetical protein JKF63_01654 [Porcisia hertigi]|uniref:Uncharacterized protein n=1 Tax=Porcisia hertigi TaxID=2761500 RepID=A0A836L1J4_9TRYP|nr:hypothetical protein JKF63_01654 [Porcisia hertigi]